MSKPRILGTALFATLALFVLAGQASAQSPWSVDETGMIASPAVTEAAPTLVASNAVWAADETGMLVRSQPTLAERVDGSLYASAFWAIDETGMLASPRIFATTPESLIEAIPAD